MKTIQTNKNNYPYLVIRMFSAVYKRQYEGENLSVDELINKAKEIVETKNLRCCVVASATDCYYIEKDAVTRQNEIPSGGVLIGY